jgi:hypothetical protein
MAGFDLIIYGRFWVITEDLPNPLKDEQGLALASRHDRVRAPRPRARQ